MKKILLILFILSICTAANSAPPSRTYTYTTGEIIDPSKVTTNEDNVFNYLTTGVDTYADNTIVNADINSSAAIAYSKLNLNNSIVNADINTSAAIVDTKLAQITTASKISGAALTSLSSVPSGAGALPIANGGTGQITANAALNALLPSQTGNSNKSLRSDATNTSWVSISQSATKVVAASDSILTTNADYTCDGTADEVQINQAIAAVSTKGGRVVLLEGTYTIAAAIDMYSDVILQGNGWGTIIKMATSYSDTGGGIDFTTQTANRCVVQDLKIDGNAANASGSNNKLFVMGTGCDYNKFENVWFANPKIALVVDCLGDYLEIIRCRITGDANQNNTYFIELQGDYNIIDGCSFYGNATTAAFILLESTNIHCRVVNNFFDGNSVVEVGIYVVDSPTFFIISNNNFLNLDIYGISVLSTVGPVSYGTITGNTINGGTTVTADGIRLQTNGGVMNNISITGNVIFDCATQGINLLQTSAALSRITIMGNTTTSNVTTGIIIGASVAECIVMGNNCTDGVTDNGTNTFPGAAVNSVATANNT